MTRQITLMILSDQDRKRLTMFFNVLIEIDNQVKRTRGKKRTSSRPASKQSTAQEKAKSSETETPRLKSGACFLDQHLYPLRNI